MQTIVPLVRLLSVPSQWHHSPKKSLEVDRNLPHFEEIESFIKIDLNQRTAMLLLNHLRNDLGTPGTLLDLPIVAKYNSWPLIFATEKELNDCYRLILDDTRFTDQVQDSMKNLLVLACIQVHLWDLLYFIWARLLETEDADVDDSPRYYNSEMSQANQEVAEDDGSKWCTDQEEMSSDEQVDGGSDPDWWTDEGENGDTRRQVQMRNRMIIVKRNGDNLPPSYEHTD